MTNPVLIDRRAHFAQLAVQAFLGAAAFVALSWIPLAAGALLFGASAVFWARGELIVILWDRLAGGRGQRWIDDGRPPRVSTAIAALNFGALTVVVAAGLDTAVVWAAVLATSGLLIAEVVVGACLPCEIVVWAARKGWLRYERPIGDTK